MSSHVGDGLLGFLQMRLESRLLQSLDVVLSRQRTRMTQVCPQHLGFWYVSQDTLRCGEPGWSKYISGKGSSVKSGDQTGCSNWGQTNPVGWLQSHSGKEILGLFRHIPFHACAYCLVSWSLHALSERSISCCRLHGNAISPEVSGAIRSHQTPMKRFNNLWAWSLYLGFLGESLSELVWETLPNKLPGGARDLRWI